MPRISTQSPFLIVFGAAMLGLVFPLRIITDPHRPNDAALMTWATIVLALLPIGVGLRGIRIDGEVVSTSSWFALRRRRYELRQVVGYRFYTIEVKGRDEARVRFLFDDGRTFVEGGDLRTLEVCTWLEQHGIGKVDEPRA